MKGGLIMCHRRGQNAEPACRLIPAGFAANLILYADLQMDSKPKIINAFLYESGGKLGRQVGRLFGNTVALN